MTLSYFPLVVAILLSLTALTINCYLILRRVERLEKKVK